MPYADALSQEPRALSQEPQALSREQCPLPRKEPREPRPPSQEWTRQTLRQGFAALNAGNLEQAADCCRRVLAAQPDLAQGHFLVGLVALESHDRRAAYRAFAAVTRLQPRHAAAWAQLARLLLGDGRVHRAAAALRKAAACDSDDPQVDDLLGAVHALLGEHSLARDRFRAANRRRPDHPPFMLNLANNHIHHGETDAARALLEKIIALCPDSPQAHWTLSGLAAARDRRHIRQMQTLLRPAPGGEPHPRARAFYHYAIGKEREDLRQWRDAFAAYEQGARARRATVEYDEDSEIAMFEYLSEHYTRDWLDSRPPGHPTPAPIFVLGQPRTGTTLVERIIGSHPQVHSAGELQQFGLAVRRLARHRQPQRFSAALFARAKDLDPARLGALYMQTTRPLQGRAPRFLDKLPQNYLFIPLLLAALPQARIVHVTREPLDACLASFKQLFADAYLHSYTQEETARHHIRYRRLMDTWRERFPGRFYDIAYEKTVADLEPQARALLDYLRLPWHPACLDFHRQAAPVSTPSALQVRQPPHTRSVGRWKKYARQLRPMRAVLREAGMV